jgi:hypothetical protein
MSLILFPAANFAEMLLTDDPIVDGVYYGTVNGK